MDSCHIFNFLFGTKKATTELSKCFSSAATRQSQSRKSRTSERASSESSSKSSAATRGKSCSSIETHSSSDQRQLSPFKQLQIKLAGLTPSHLFKVKNSDIKKSQSSTAKEQQNCEPGRDKVERDNEHWGTYRATLVDSLDYEDQENDLVVVVDKNNNIITSTLGRAATRCQTTDSHRVTDNQSFTEFNDKDELENDKNLASEPEMSEISFLSKADEETSPIKYDRRAVFKRVVMYSSQEEEEENYEQNGEQKRLVSSAEVYKIVHRAHSESGEFKAKLRKVSSLSEDGTFEYDENGVLIIEQPAKQINDSDDQERRPEKEQSSIRILDKRSIHVRNLVQSFESNFRSLDSPTTLPASTEDTNFNSNNNNHDTPINSAYKKPITFVKPLPPKTPPKSNKAKCLNLQLSLNKPIKIKQLFLDEEFLIKFFGLLEPLDRCVAAQVCRLWRNILYANQNYWKDLISVIDCNQLRREHLVECILNTLQSAKLKQQITKDSKTNILNSAMGKVQENGTPANYFEFDQEDIWRIQELCNRFTYRTVNSTSKHHIQTDNSNQYGAEQQTICTTSKSSSIPSQISSTLSSVSLSSIISPLSESSRIDSIKEKLYNSLNNRGFDAICLFGATDDDIEDFIAKLPSDAYSRISVGKFNNCSITDKGLELFLETFNSIEELELSGCNEISNLIELESAKNLKRLILTDCINIADGFAQKLVPIMHQLDELTIQAYHLTDNFLDYLCKNSNTGHLLRLELPNCKEITNQSLVEIADHFQQLEALSISGSTKIEDAAIGLLAEKFKNIKFLDLSWCSLITDEALECIACDLGETITELILDRNMNITDMGLDNLSTMSKLSLLHIRWCPRITDLGLESVMTIKSLRHLSIAGLHQVTARSLLCLIETDLDEIELTNCPAVNHDLVLYLTSKSPKCNIIF